MVGLLREPPYILNNRRFIPNEQLNNPFASPPMGMKMFNPLDEFRLEGISRKEQAELYAYSVMVYAAINFRAVNISQVPMIVKDRNGEKIANGLLPRMFNRRSGYVDKMKRAELSTCIFGYNLFHKATNALNIPIELQWVNPTSYMVDADNYRGLKGFRVTASHTQDETGGYLYPDEVVFSNLLDLSDDFDGISPTEVAFASASADTEIAQTIYAVFRNMAIPATFVQPTSDTANRINDNDVDMLTRLFRSIVQGARNAGRTLVSPKRWEFVTLQPPFRDLDTRHLTDQVREQVAIAFGIPIELLFASASNYAQFEGVRRSWAHTWLVPQALWYADAFTEQLASDFDEGYTVEPDFDAVPFLKEDMASRVNVVNSKLQMGLITYGEAQRQLGEEVIPQLDKMVYSPALNAPVPIETATTMWEKLNGAFAPENEAHAPSVLDDSVPVFPERPTVEDLKTPMGSKSWIPDTHYAELRAWKKKAGKERKCDFAPNYLRQDIVEFVEKALDETDDTPDIIFANAKAWLSQKSIQSTRLNFESDFEDILAEGRNGGLNRRRFGTLVRAIIAKYGRRAYRDGLIDGGIEDGDMDTEDFQAVDAIIAQQSAYVTNFADKVFKEGLSDAMAYGKPEMWFNKSLYPMYEAGLASADKNGLYEWVLGNAEHCRTCLALNGQKHRMKEYVKRGLVPKSDKLECKGFKCACNLVRTTGRAKGRFPVVASAGKHTHISGVHDPDNLLNEDAHV